MTEELRLSVSKTKTFNSCKKQYEFSYILKFPQKEFIHHTFGKLCHKILEDFHNAYIKESSDKPFHVEMGKVFKAAIHEYKDKITPEMKQECWDLFNKYLKMISEDKKNHVSANVLACEKYFEIPIGEEVVLNGMIDRIQLDSDNIIHVADYKSTKNKKYLKDDWIQLLTYCYIIYLENPDVEKVRASYILLRHDFEYITKEFFLDEILTVKDKYLDYASKIRKETEFLPTPTNLCPYCSFLEHCSAGLQKVKPKPSYGEINW